jgi:hypothetical protein
VTAPEATSDDPFIQSLVRNLVADPDVVGLVLAGSSAETARRDRWSDHDFLVITEDGTPERYRTQLEWLPDPAAIAFWFRETAHGLKVLYRTGLMVEFAVFDRAEFAGCALNHYAVAIDRGGIADAAAAVRGRTMTFRHVDRAVEFRTLLSLLYVGTGRARRGELLSANVFVRNYAVDHLLRLARDLLPDDQGRRLDALDVWRRFETADADLAREIDASLSLPVEPAARALLDVADRWLLAHWPEYPREDTEVLRGLLGW